jgi:hypothetical protein
MFFRPNSFQSVEHDVWVRARKILPYGVTFALAIAVGWSLSRWEFTHMGPALARYFAQQGLESDSASSWWIEPKFLREAGAKYRDSADTWKFTYSVSKPGYEGAVLYVTVDKFGAYVLSGNDVLVHTHDRIAGRVPGFHSP